MVVGMYICMQCDIHPPPQTIAGHILIQYNNSTSLSDIAMFFNIHYVTLKNDLYKAIHGDIIAAILLPSISFYSEIFIHISVHFDMHIHKTSCILKNVIYKHTHGDNGTLLLPCTLIYNAILQNIPLHLSPFIYIYTPILYILTYKIVYLLSPSICLYKTIIPSKYLIRVTCVPETQMNKDANEDGWELVMNRK